MIRSHILAGSWYPQSPREIAEVLAEYLQANGSPRSAIGVIAPHAGWRYCGKVAGKVFALVEVPDTVVVLAPNHRGVGKEKAIWHTGAWKIPTGTLNIDEELAAKMVSCAKLQPDVVAHQLEHSLEILLPFVFHKNPKVAIVPVSLMAIPLFVLKEIGEGIARAIQECGRKVLIVASSDMSHYVSANEARRLDSMAIEMVEKLDPEGLYRVVRENSISMCGVTPVTAMLYAAKCLGASYGKLIHYATSGEVTGDQSEVVGYAGMLIE